jgi:uroporphyrinogen III methyltransferase / synthase
LYSEFGTPYSKLMPKRKVYLVGAGPGDAGLITLKGYQLICQADIIIYDHLIPLELLNLARPDTEIIAVGKFAGKHPIPQEEINQILIEKAKENKVVVRLKGGDPYLFGRGGEEAQACAEAGIEFEVVPGVTSAIAATAYAGIPATHRDYTSSVAIVTGHRKEDLELQIPKAGTVIFLMGVANIGKIVDSLLKQNWPKQTPIAAIENGTCYNQRVIKGALENFLDVVEKANLQTPAVFIVGKVVEMQGKLDWFSKKPKVLVLGTHPEKYKHLGTIIHRQIIDCVPIENYSLVDSIIKKELNTFDWLIFTSVNGVKYFFQRLNSVGLDARAIGPVKIAVIGKTTAEKLACFGILADLVADIESSDGLLGKFTGMNLKGRKILLPRADIASNQLYNGLIKAGAAVQAVTVYKTIEIDPGDIDFYYIDKVLFTSGSVIRAFVKRFSPVPTHIKYLCLGLPSLEEAKRNGINAELLKTDTNVKE